MMFASFCGDPEFGDAWTSLAEAHGAWLGRSASLQRRSLRSGELFALASFPHPEFDDPPARMSDDEFRFNAHAATPDRDALDPSCCFSFGTGELRASVFPTSPSQFYYGRDRRGRVFGNDMRILLRWLGIELDDLAVFGLLQYGAIPASRTLSRRLHRLPGGRSLRWSADSRDPEIDDWFHATDPPRDHPDPLAAVAGGLDAVLERVPKESVLLFSGGVDSALLAVRLLELGRQDVRLVNYDFGAGDLEAKHALRVASSLSWECEVVPYDSAGVVDVLGDLARDYPFPYADFSCMTTNLLVRAAAAGAPAGAAVIDGTGADGAFGFGPRHRAMEQIYAIPRPMRQLVSASYRGLQLWKLDSSSRLEAVTRVLRRSVQTSLEHSLVAQNPLDGIGYRMGAARRARLEQAITDDFERLSEGTGSLTRLSYLDLVMVCAAQFAPKTDEPIRSHGLRPVFPYLEPGMIRQSEAIAWRQKCEAGESKGVLKKLLLERLPRELIYRPKHGFAPPFHAMLTEPAIQAFVRDALFHDANPILDFVEAKPLEAILSRAESGRALAHGAYSFLWSAIAASAWTQQIELS
jgi:asparagine synthase (glutamine-hydrolysing)